MGATGLSAAPRFSRLRHRAPIVVHAYADLERSRIEDDYRLAGKTNWWSFAKRRAVTDLNIKVPLYTNNFSGVRYGERTMNKLSDRYETRLLFTEKISMDFCCCRTDVKRQLYVTIAKKTTIAA